MWAAEPPAASASDAAQACARGTRNKEVASRLLAARAEMETNSGRLRQAARQHRLHKVSASEFALRDLSDTELKSVYSLQLGRSGRPASPIRDQLLGSAPHGLCCYCQYGQATTLDHFVPKEHVPALSIDPWNLVPACDRCNHRLQSLYGTVASEQMFHPYSMPELGRWIHAEIVPGTPTSVTFSASPGPLIGEDLQKRIIYEFRSLGLGTLFSIVSGPDLAEINATLTSSFPLGNRISVGEHLTDVATTALAVNLNSRRGALFEALARDDEYCDGAYAANTPVR